MDKFRKRNIQILVATDVAARGIDVDSITHVINYNIPEEIESYTHRSGRTARAGKKGTSICVITPAELYKIKKIEKIIKSQFTLAKIPSGQDVCEQQMFSLIDKIRETEVDQNEIEKFMPTIAEKLQDYTADEIIEKFIYMEFSRFLAYYKKSGRDINKTKSDARDRGGRDRDRGRGRDRDRGRGRDRDVRGDRGDRSPRGRDRGDRGGSRGGGVSAGHTLIFINAGSTDNLNTGQLINWVCKNCGISGEQIGAIRVRDRFSFFEVQNGLVDKVVNQTGLTMKDRRISMEVSKS
jgi:ATP-dependent RNA helicase DeaD